MRTVLIAMTFAFSFSAEAFELMIFNKLWSPEGHCQLVASDAKYGFETHMRCSTEQDSVEIYFDQSCPISTLKKAAMKAGNSVTTHAVNDVEYQSYLLKNTNTSKFETARVIKDSSHCAISFYDSANVEQSPLAGLWVVKN